MTEDDLNWRIEEACANAWPAARQLVLDRWLLRAAGGASRRTNSVSPLRAAHYDPAAVIGTVEPIYAALRQPSIFRVPDLAAGMDRVLEAAGYVADEDVCTLFADLADQPVSAPDPAVSLDPIATEAWLAARSRFATSSPAGDRVYRETVGCLLVPAMFAALMVDGAIASIGYAAIDRGIMVLESVATSAVMRSRGYGRRTVAALMGWAAATGAEAACLQVVSDNPPARQLYAGLGFTRELYRYHYRHKASQER